MSCVPIARRVTYRVIGIVTAINSRPNSCITFDGYRIIVGAGGYLGIYCAPGVASINVITGKPIVTAINSPANSSTVNGYRIIVGAGCYLYIN